MFDLLRQLTELDDSNVFAKDQGRSQWPDITPYDKSRGVWAKTASFDVSVRLRHFSSQCIEGMHFRTIVLPE
jgi:hypothetical protein